MTTVVLFPHLLSCLGQKRIAVFLRRIFKDAGLTLDHDGLEFWELFIAVNDYGSAGIPAKVNDFLTPSKKIDSPARPTEPHRR